YRSFCMRTRYLNHLLNTVFNVLVFYFLSIFIDQATTPTLVGIEGDYFSFVLIGVAFGGYFNAALTSYSSSLREAQTTGTLEAMLMTPASLPAIVTGSAAWSYIFTTFRVLVYLLVGMLVADLRFTGANYLAALAGLLLAIISFASIGIIAAGVIMVVKRGNPVTVIFASVANLVSGVFYPVEVLPQWLQVVARFMPLTYALRLMRQSLLAGASWPELANDFLALFLFAVILFPLSLLVFRTAVQRARLEGTLAHY
ncbi:MAG: ABC transporter permease, partial [Candidatus Promineifilaceae bacterium]